MADVTKEFSEPLNPVDVRKRTGLTQTQAAGLLDTRPATLSDWENKRTVPRLTPSKWLLLMRASKLTPEQLVAAYEPEQVEMIEVRLKAAGIDE